MESIRGTTILCVRRNNSVAIGGDGQATIGNTIAKENVNKIRSFYNKSILAGFAGSTSDAFALFEKFESKLKIFNKNLEKAAIELSKEWRSNGVSKRLDAMIIVSDVRTSLLISGAGDVMSSDKNDILSIGSGSSFAKSAAHALIENTNLDACDIVRKSLLIAADICIYTNHNLVIESITDK